MRFDQTKMVGAPETESQAVETRYMSITQWHELAQGGVVLPMCIALDGDSMRPLIRRGRDKVIIVPLTRPLKRGDVVLFEAPPGRYVVHRVYRFEDGRVQTLGDHCYRPDAWMSLEDVLGIVVEVERGTHIIGLDTFFPRCMGCFWMIVFPVRRFYFLARSILGKGLRMLEWRK